MEKRRWSSIEGVAESNDLLVFDEGSKRARFSVRDGTSVLDIEKTEDVKPEIKRE
jgi:hypothetical protein